MDPDSSEKNHKKYQDINGSVDDSDVFQPAWLRRTFRPCNEVDRFLLDYGYHFLFPIGIILWTLYLAAQI
jgi:hypothetical protein